MDRVYAIKKLHTTYPFRFAGDVIGTGNFVVCSSTERDVEAMIILSTTSSEQGTALHKL